MTYTPEQLREDGHFGTREEMIARYKELKAALAAALEELARVKAAQLADKTKKHDALWARLNPSIEYVEGTPVGYGEDEIDRQTQRAERAEAALAESERKCERLTFHADAACIELQRWAAAADGIGLIGVAAKTLAVIDAYRADFKG